MLLPIQIALIEKSQMRGEGWEEGEAGTLLSSLSPSHHPPRDFFFRLSPVSPRHKVLIGIATFVTD